MTDNIDVMEGTTEAQLDHQERLNADELSPAELAMCDALVADETCAERNAILAGMDAAADLSPEELRAERLRDLERLLFKHGVQEQLRWLPDRLKNARRSYGEEARKFETRKERMRWQLTMLNTLDAAPVAEILARLMEIEHAEFDRYERDPAEGREQLNEALFAIGTIVQNSFRASVNAVLFNENVAQDREARAHARAQANAGLDPDQRPANDHSEELGDGDRAHELIDAEEGADTAEPGRLVLEDVELARDLLVRQPLGDQIDALTHLHARLATYKMSVESDIEWGSFGPRPLEFYSVRDDADVLGRYLSASSYADARELYRKANADAEAQAAKRSEAGRLSRRAVMLR